MSTGKWRDPGVPHRGWTHHGCEDTGELSTTCEMCEKETIRHVHFVTHPDYPTELRVGAEQIEALRTDHAALRRELAPLFDIIDDHPPLEDRLVGTGVLSAEDATALGCVGYMGKASGQAFDLRRDGPYAPYDGLEVRAVTETAGDVAARVRVRMAELLDSLDLMDRLLESLPTGDIVAELPPAAPGAQGLGLLEGWRGETLAWVRFGDEGRIARYFPRDPSWFAWPALERLIHGNIVPDFPVCNKSVNGSYAGVDL